MRQSMVSYRHARKVMGFTHTSAYVPNSKLADFSLYVERLKAERMLEICEEPVSSPARRALAQRNFVDIPTPQEINGLIERNKAHKEIVKHAKLSLFHSEQYATALSASRKVDTDDEYIRWISEAVAHNHMVSVIWREACAAAQSNGKHKYGRI